ncbi:MAG: histidinol dehydrogenase [Hyphomicrobiales bacterium]
MVYRLETSADDFDGVFSEFLNAKRQAASDVGATVSAIIDQVRAQGDTALVTLTQRFDRFALTPESLRISRRECAEAVAGCDPGDVQALHFAHRRILAYHQRQMPRDDWFEDADGVGLGHRWTPVDAAGLYVPGGTAAYPSSVLMNATPARVAGVDRLVMTVPTPDGTLNPLVLAAAEIAGVDEIYRIGGAQAIAALAYGTQTIAAVDKIVGPGNAYVAAAKAQVFGQVGIDMIAGPSEVLVIADDRNDPAWIAADLLAQAEHDTAAQSILITDSAGFSARVEQAVATQLKTLPRAKIAQASWHDYGALIVVDTLDAAIPLANRIAPEHLEIATDNPEKLAAGIRNAGAIFLGRYTPEAIGDYVGGPNHVLPTSRSARFSSALGVLDFLKRTSLLKCDASSLARLSPSALRLARAEGLDAHARSMAMRLNHQDPI